MACSRCDARMRADQHMTRQINQHTPCRNCTEEDYRIIISLKLPAITPDSKHELLTASELFTLQLYQRPRLALSSVYIMWTMSEGRIE
jgi:hypothetical protein